MHHILDTGLWSCATGLQHGTKGRQPGSQWSMPACGVLRISSHAQLPWGAHGSRRHCTLHCAKSRRGDCIVAARRDGFWFLHGPYSQQCCFADFRPNQVACMHVVSPRRSLAQVVSNSCQHMSGNAPMFLDQHLPKVCRVMRVVTACRTYAIEAWSAKAGYSMLPWVKRWLMPVVSL